MPEGDIESLGVMGLGEVRLENYSVTVIAKVGPGPARPLGPLGPMWAHWALWAHWAHLFYLFQSIQGEAVLQ